LAVKDKNKGRARGDFIIGKKEWKIDKCNLIGRDRRKGKGVIRSELEIDKEFIIIISVYGEQGGKNLIESLKIMLEAEGEENVIIGREFNLKIKNLDKKEVEEGETDRHSKDLCIGNGGRRFMD